MEEITKITHLRNNEYYCMQEPFDFLYNKSQKGNNFYLLIEYIRLAYRNTKTNNGSKTNGLSGNILKKLKKLSQTTITHL